MKMVSLFAVTGLIAVLTVGIVFLPDPEVRVLTSPDGAFTVTGLARQSQEISLAASGEALGMPLVGHAYDVLPTGLVLDAPLTMVVPLSELGLADAAVHLFRYDEASGIWTGVTDPVRVKDGLLVATTPVTGRYAVGLRQTVDAPEFLSMEDELLALAPGGTVSYAITIGYRLDGGPVVALPGSGRSGGCGGVFQEGNTRRASELTRDVVVGIDDVATTATFLFHATWVVDEIGGGCTPEAPLSALMGS